VLAGNHEQYVLHWRDRDPNSSEILHQFYASALWTFRQLDGHIEALAQLPAVLPIIDPVGQELRLTHASMRGLEDGIYPETEDEQLRKQIAPAPAIFLTAHTHRPLKRVVDETIVINSGSVGSPFDGDLRACYVQLSQLKNGWQSRLVRLSYDRDQTREHFHTSGYLEGGGPLTRIILHEWETARPTIRRFFQRYEAPVLAGQIELDKAVSSYLNQEFEIG
jgi:diadenosine tetraphosphatase ApaH/serine/threonine PP2A family protein phosphatase